MSYGAWIVLGIAAIVVVSIAWTLLRRLLLRLLGADKQLDKLRWQKKSSEVRLGKIAETMAPLMDGFPVPVGAPGSATLFLGQPVDYIHFSSDGAVTFIEVKSGGAVLSPFQRLIREAIEAGRVGWVEYRVDGTGYPDTARPKDARVQPGDRRIRAKIKANKL